MSALSPEPRHASAADFAACAAMIRGGSRTFFAASLLLPRSVRQPACALYAFCRLADDAIDIEDGRMSALAALRERLRRAYDGRPLPLAADRAFADTVAQFEIPRALPEALLDGFAWDAAGRRYEDLSELCGYAARVAGSVGAMMAILMGVRSPRTVARACDLGVAMQLSNIARDVGEDARAGRLYLPLRWLREADVDPEGWLARPVFDQAVGGVIQRLLRAADLLYERADDGIAQLPWGCRPAIAAARVLYAEIGRQVERNGCDSVSRRAVVPSARKLALLPRVLTQTMSALSGMAATDLPEAAFLVEAVGALRSQPGITTDLAAGRTVLQRFDDRASWVVDLFERLERREQLQRLRP